MRSTQRNTNIKGFLILIRATKYIKIHRKSWRISLPIEKTPEKNWELVAKKIPERKKHLRGFTVLICRDFV